DSLLLTPLCCDDIYDVTPCVSALAGYDRLVLEPLVIENYVSLIRKKFCWGTIFPIELKRYKDPKEEPIEKEPLMELKEIGLLIARRMLVVGMDPWSRVTLAKAKSNSSKAQHKFIPSFTSSQCY
ncbi:hypothetical protein Tco_0041800, partial [Tanacetum coccineum]